MELISYAIDKRVTIEGNYFQFVFIITWEGATSLTSFQQKLGILLLALVEATNKFPQTLTVHFFLKITSFLLLYFHIRIGLELVQRTMRKLKVILS